MITFDLEQEYILNDITPIILRWQKFSLFFKKPVGIYLYGPPGTGKTTIMDLIYENFPKKKQRQHLKPFMMDLQKSGFEAMIEKIKSLHLLCLDECEVTDIADAMVMKRLLQECKSKRIAVFFTSNVQPQDLYKEGLHRDRFLPTIDFLENYYHLIKLDGGIDYRQTSKHSKRYEYLSHLSQKAHQSAVFGDIFLHDEAQYSVAHFDDLFSVNFGPLQYRKLAETHDEVRVVMIPEFTYENMDAVKRFITCIDFFYDMKKCLKVDQIPKVNLDIIDKLPILRAISRLNEMSR